MSWRGSAAALVAVALMAACSGGGSRVSVVSGDSVPTGSTEPSTSASATPAPTPPTQPLSAASPHPTTAPGSKTCENGWETPKFGSRLWNEGLGIIRSYMRLADAGKMVVNDIRYFQGPESPPTDKGYLAVVRRWYVKGYLAEDHSFRGRWLAEARQYGNGVSAVAPYGTVGFSSPDWSGFQYEGPHEVARSYRGLPGRWAGTRYDFVQGGGRELGMDFPGLPAEVAGCMAGT